MTRWTQVKQNNRRLCYLRFECAVLTKLMQFRLSFIKFRILVEHNPADKQPKNCWPRHQFICNKKHNVYHEYIQLCVFSVETLLQYFCFLFSCSKVKCVCSVCLPCRVCTRRRSSLAAWSFLPADLKSGIPLDWTHVSFNACFFPPLFLSIFYCFSLLLCCLSVSLLPFFASSLNFHAFSIFFSFFAPLLFVVMVPPFVWARAWFLLIAANYW